MANLQTNTNNFWGNTSVGFPIQAPQNSPPAQDGSQTVSGTNPPSAATQPSIVPSAATTAPAKTFSLPSGSVISTVA